MSLVPVKITVTITTLFESIALYIVPLHRHIQIKELTLLCSVAHESPCTIFRGFSGAKDLIMRPISDKGLEPFLR